MKELQSRIKRLLDTKEIYRDSDGAMMARIWYEDFERLDNNSIRTGNFVHFLIALRDNKLTNWDSATRCRRKIQESFPYLRGKKYRFRKENATEAIKKELRAM